MCGAAPFPLRKPPLPLPLPRFLVPPHLPPDAPHPPTARERSGAAARDQGRARQVVIVCVTRTSGALTHVFSRPRYRLRRPPPPPGRSARAPRAASDAALDRSRGARGLSARGTAQGERGADAGKAPRRCNGRQGRAHVGHALEGGRDCGQDARRDAGRRGRGRGLRGGGRGRWRGGRSGGRGAAQVARRRRAGGVGGAWSAGRRGADCSAGGPGVG